MAMRAVVFAYHNVGVRCLQVLLGHGVDVALVITHELDPQETIWFESVSAFCAAQGIECLAPADAASPELLDLLKVLQPDLLFSFYYRHMLPASLLQVARLGSFNMHGSLLPKYRGRAPVNWAILHGETMTGTTLHEMVEKPDAGAIVAQQAVSILPDETAHDVFGKVVVAAEQTLSGVLPKMLGGTIPRRENDLSKGSYYGGRTAADGQIDWAQPAQVVYNLIRAVAPPYPGAWTILNGDRFIVARARLSSDRYSLLPRGLMVVGDCMLGICGDGHAIKIHELHRDGEVVTAITLQALLATSHLVPSKHSS